MIDEIAVRFAEIDDLDFCQKMEFDLLLPSVTKEKLEYLIGEREIVIAEINNNPVGYLRIEYLWHKIPYIGLILVDEGHRKIGVGKSLLAFIERHLKSSGHATLYSSSTQNEPEPQQWHQHVGFEKCGIIDGINEGNIGEVFFRKQIE